MSAAVLAGGIAREVLTGAVLVLAALAVTLLAGTVAVRAQRRRRAALDERLSAGPRRLLYALVADDEPDPALAAELVGLDRRTWAAVEPTVVGLLGKLRGDARAVFVDVLVRRGGVDAALARARTARAVGRAHAAELLGAVGGPDALAELDHLLGDPDPDVRAVATRGLGRIADPTAAFGLVSRLGGRHAVHAPDHLVAQALIRVGEPATNPLRAAALDARPEVRSTAVAVLGHIRSVPAVDDLVTALAHDPEPAVRVHAARALGAVGSPRALPALVDAVDPALPPALRVAAVVALGRVGAARSVEHLAALADDPEHWVAHHAAAALVGLGRPGTTALADLAADRSRPRARAHAREALAAVDLPLPPEPLPPEPLPPEVPPPGAAPAASDTLRAAS